MVFLLLYIVAGIITARFFERKNCRVELIAHAVMFTVLLFFVLILQDDIGISSVMRRSIGNESYDWLRAVMSVDSSGNYSIGSALVLLQLAVVLLSVFAAMISVSTIITARRIKKTNINLLHSSPQKPQLNAGRKTDNYKKTPIFRVNCRMNA